MRITCPHCGERGLEEFSYQGDAGVVRPEESEAAEAWTDYVYLRQNPAGLHREHWQHLWGCRAWLVVTRDTRSHAIAGVEAAGKAARGVAGKASP
jgi:sarcosine oxidase subunit delta